ncbi:aldehyde dehydrogenase [Nitrincola nitratireducens]
MCFIDGEFRPSLSGKTIPTTNPATGQIIAQLAAGNAADVDLAVSAAKIAFNDQRWCSLHPNERKHVLINLCHLVETHKHELAVLESMDSGKPIRDCELIDIPEFIHVVKWHAELIDKIYDQSAPVGPNAVAMVVREPIGVVAAVLPWNFPLLMLAWKIGPALAAGCSMVIKPAAQTSLTALRIAELALEAGLPRGILNIVTGTGVEVGEPLGRHKDVDMVTFTGSTATGKRFLSYSAESNLKKVVLECGGKNPCIVLEDAEHLDKVAAFAVQAAFWNMGENCSAGSRLIVHKSIKSKLLERIKAHACEWKTGDPLNPANHLGALIDKCHFAKVANYIQLGKESNASLIFGGECIDGAFIHPTIFDDVMPDDALAQEEIFGPVLSIITVSSFDEAIAVANNSDYGLSASVFTSHAKRAIRAAQSIKAGTVTVNCFGEGDITTPFGGYKQSGFGGRDNSIHAHDQFTELKTIWIDLSDDSDDSLD